jgi:hypothetical protein
LKSKNNYQLENLQEEMNIKVSVELKLIFKYLNQEEATKIDVDLMSPEQGFSNDQLMELAGKCF